MRHSAARPRPALLSGFSLLVLIFLLTLSPASLSAEERKQPNLIWIMADDPGYAELGCYGQKIIRTPRIERMAAEGLRFTHYYAGATVCTLSPVSLRFQWPHLARHTPATVESKYP